MVLEADPQFQRLDIEQEKTYLCVVRFSELHGASYLEGGSAWRISMFHLENNSTWRISVREGFRWGSDCWEAEA